MSYFDSFFKYIGGSETNSIEFEEIDTTGINTNISQTENSDKAYSTTGSKCLDFFTRITRGATLADYVESFFQALKEDQATATKLLFNLRDIRSGKGEKLIPIVLMVCLKHTNKDIYQSILELFVSYGCWKDILKIIEISNRLHLELNPELTINEIDNSVEYDMFAVQLKSDYDKLLEADTNTDTKISVSLCAKWAPSENTHFNKNPICAADNIRLKLKQNPKQYRQMLGALRSHLNILERLMSSGQTDKIQFENVPSVAMMKMKNSFNRETNAAGVESESRKNLRKSYQAYLAELTQGKTKVNVKGIQPHELIKTYLHNPATDIDQLVEAQWTTLVNKVKESGIFKNTLAVVDTSSSMNGQPLEVAIALGILVSECTESSDKKVITFNTTPRWHQLVGSNLKDKVISMNYGDWGGSTNLRKTFELILTDATNSNLSLDQMVSTLIIFTDMQFDSVTDGEKWQTTFETCTNLFKEAGYTLPKIVCWNLRTSSAKSLPVSMEDEGYVMLSGFSAELLKYILTGDEFSPIKMMLHVLEAYVVPLIPPSNIYNVMNTSNIYNVIDIGSLQKAIDASMFKKSFKVNK